MLAIMGKLIIVFVNNRLVMNMQAGNDHTHWLGQSHPSPLTMRSLGIHSKMRVARVARPGRTSLASSEGRGRGPHALRRPSHFSAWFFTGLPQSIEAF